MIYRPEYISCEKVLLLAGFSHAKNRGYEIILNPRTKKERRLHAIIKTGDIINLHEDENYESDKKHKTIPFCKSVLKKTEEMRAIDRTFAPWWRLFWLLRLVKPLTRYIPCFGRFFR